MKDSTLRAIEVGFVVILLAIVVLLSTGCASTPDPEAQAIKDAEWSCTNSELAEYEHRSKDMYVKIRCK